MNIVHVCLAAPFNDGWAYQENMLACHHAMAGHMVTIIATPFTTDPHGGGRAFHFSGSYTDSVGVQVVREPLSSRNWRGVWTWLSTYGNVFEDIEAADPDVLFVHGCQFLDILKVARYVKAHPNVRVYVDNHADYANSARNWLSKSILHGVIWRALARAIDPYVTKWWGVTEAGSAFLAERYGISPDRIGLLPLGADVPDLSEAVARQIRHGVRSEIGVDPNDFLIVSGGKIDARKQIHTLMQVFDELSPAGVSLLIFGSVQPDVADTVLSLAARPHINYVGWADTRRICEYFIASDLAVFPGSQSTIWAQAVACGIPGVFRRWEGGTPVDIGGNCVLLEHGAPDEIKDVIQRILDDHERYATMKRCALGEGARRFSYAEIADRAIEVV